MNLDLTYPQIDRQHKFSELQLKARFLAVDFDRGITMTTDVTITLSDEVYARAERFARLANRDVAALLSDRLQLSIPEVVAEGESIVAVSALSDAEVLALTELQLDPVQDQRLTLLLDRQQAGVLIADERSELRMLMQLYQEGLLRKATALAEAVKRGLIEPLQS
jgi:hypothetical protein